MIGIPVGLFVANAAEWIFHKHVLHKIGRDKKSIWAFHHMGPNQDSNWGVVRPWMDHIMGTREPEMHKSSSAYTGA